MRTASTDFSLLVPDSLKETGDQATIDSFIATFQSFMQLETAIFAVGLLAAIAGLIMLGNVKSRQFAPAQTRLGSAKMLLIFTAISTLVQVALTIEVFVFISVMKSNFDYTISSVGVNVVRAIAFTTLCATMVAHSYNYLKATQKEITSTQQG